MITREGNHFFFCRLIMHVDVKQAPIKSKMTRQSDVRNVMSLFILKMNLSVTSFPLRTNGISTKSLNNRKFHNQLPRFTFTSSFVYVWFVMFQNSSHTSNVELNCVGFGLYLRSPRASHAAACCFRRVKRALLRSVH